MNLLENYTNLKEMLIEASNPTNVTQVEIFELVYNKFLEEGEILSKLVRDYHLLYSNDFGMTPPKVPEELKGFLKMFNEDKQEILKKLLDYDKV